MNKYSKILDKLKRIPLGIMVILSGLILAILPFFVIGEYILISIIACFSFAVGGFLILQGVGIAFFNQKHENTGYVHDGETVLRAEQTPQYIGRTVWYCFIECIAYLGLAIYYFIMASLSEYSGFFIVFGIISIIVAIIYFLNAAKRKVDLKNNATKKQKE